MAFHTDLSNLQSKHVARRDIIMLVSEDACAYWVVPGKRWFLMIRNVSLGMTCLERRLSGHSLVSARLCESSRHISLLSHCAEYPMPTFLVTAWAMAMTACMPSLPVTVRLYGQKLIY